MGLTYQSNETVLFVDERSTLNLSNNGVFKVGVDLEAGIYNISLCGDNSYYGTVFLNDDEKN